MTKGEKEKEERVGRPLTVVVVEESRNAYFSLFLLENSAHVELFRRIIVVARATVSNDETQGGPLHPWVKLTARGGPVEEKGRGGRDTAVL